jgi:hypothetical protein
MLIALTLIACQPDPQPPADDSEATAPESPATDDSERVESPIDDSGQGEEVLVTGATSCATCTGSVGLLFLGSSGRSVTRVVSGSGAFEVSVPSSLGTVTVGAWGDEDGDGLQDAGEPLGASLEIYELGEGVEGVEIELGASGWDPDLEYWGVQLETGFWVLPNLLTLEVSEGATLEELQAIATAQDVELLDFIDEVDRAWLTLETEGLSGEEALAQLELVEAALSDEDIVLASWREPSTPGAPRTRTQADDDYLLHSDTATLGQAHSAARVDQAKDVYDDCAFHFEGSQSSRAVKLAVVDADLNGLEGVTEVPSGWEAHRETITARHGFPASVAWHGSAVSSVINGQNNKKYLSGFLSGFEGDNRGAYSVAVQLMPWNVGHGANITPTTGLYGLYKAVTYDHAQVVNASFGFRMDQMWMSAWLRHIADLKEEVTRSSSTMFVFAAPNEELDIDTVHDWTTLGAILDNVISVGGVQGSSPFGASSKVGALLLSGEVNTGFWRRPVTHQGGATAIGDEELSWDYGTSFVAPQVSSALALALAFDSTRSPGSLRELLVATGDPNEAATDRGGRTLNLQRLTVNLLGKELDSQVEYLMRIDVSPPDVSTCGPSGVLANHKCIPLQETGAGIAGAKDADDATYTISASKFGTSEGADFDLSVEGSGLAPVGIQPHKTRYIGTVSRPGYAAEEDLVVTGRYAGQPQSSSCTYSGDFTATLLRVRVPE